MHIRAIEAPCGAEISNVDLSQELSTEQVGEIRQAWLKYHVLVFPEQNLSVDDLARFTLYFGNFGEDPFFNSIEEHSNIAAIRRDADEKTSLFAENWHTDWSFQPKPPIGTCLYGIKIPPNGGDTLFANQHKAYDDLPADLKSKIENLTAIHSAASGYSPDGLYSDQKEHNVGRSMDIVVSDEARRTHTHPLIRPHTETGRPAIYSTAGYIERFEELSEKESKALLKELYRYQSSNQFVYRHQWQPNMLVMWDNRSVLHKATSGYEGHNRLLHRTTIAEFE
ncbi:MAG: TauD/TfdA family dioxygenase [Pseudomonadales bacterium]|nr:TauD/TfdA family dioxygenase [Pseudomonadales bacterium]